VGRNPFTGKEISVTTTEPPEADAGTAARAWDLRADEVLGKENGYEGYLESRTPPEIRALPHRLVKRVVLLWLPLAEALGSQGDLPEALYPPSGCATSLPLLRVPDAIVASLRGLSDDAMNGLAARLAKDEEFADWGVPNVRDFLGDLRNLARLGAREDGLYVLPV
jgi:hypothetical protein